MARPIPRTRPPAGNQHRSGSDIVGGVLALLALAVLIVGVPAALLSLFGAPVPHSMPTLSVVRHQLDVFTILKVLSVLVWLAWLQLLACVVVEIRAAVRNSGMPARVPLAGGTQQLVHRLVTATVLAFSATTALAPAFAQQVPAWAAQPGWSIGSTEIGPTEAAAAVQQARLDQARLDQAQLDQASVPEVGNAHAEKIYVVRPPVGRYHESLWEIASKYLGDGRRYREIFELNEDRVQPDGIRLTIASLIRPGWVLRMPPDAHGPGIEAVGAPLLMPPDAHDPGIQEAGPPGSVRPGPVTQLEPTAKPAPPTAEPAPPTAEPAPPTAEPAPPTAEPAPPTAEPAAPPTAEPAPAAHSGHAGSAPHRGGSSSAAAAHASGVEAAHASPGVSYPTALVTASLLAAGVLAALGRRRREQLWRRAFGRRLTGPSPQAALAEAALRLCEHEPDARLLDDGLRYLSQALAAQGRTPPTVFAAYVGEDNIDLWVAPADRNSPSPWTSVADGQVWRLPQSAVQRIDPDQISGALAPFPGLVSIGTDGAGRVLVDLEAAHGLIAVTGPQAMVTAALSAMAVELATNRWSDTMRITLVGFGSDLVALAPDRIHSVATLDETLPALEARAAEVEAAMAESRVDTVLTGRSTGINANAWEPHYLLMASQPTQAEQERLLALARVQHAAAAGYVVAGEVPGSAWTWEVTPEGRLYAGLLGFDVAAQLLPPAEHTALAELFEAAADVEGSPLEPPAVDAVPAAHLVPGSAMPVEITLLGPAGVDAPGIIEPDRVSVALEIVVYLAVHPGGVHPNVLAAAIWPRGVATQARDAAIASAARWLGSDGIGRPQLAADASGRLRLGSGVRVDWDVFLALTAHARQARPGGTDEAATAAGVSGEAAYLSHALDLVTGRLLDGRLPGRYAWLAADDLEYEVTARVADAAHRLAQLRLAAGDALASMDAARAGLRLAFDDELLWRDLLLGAHATGQEDVLRSVVDEMCARTELDPVLPRMAPETEALIDQLYPSWRSSVA